MGRRIANVILSLKKRKLLEADEFCEETKTVDFFEN